jgi:tRNA dimethylallyltransferase
MAGRRTVTGPRLVVVLGPTATGKSDLGVKLAQHFGGEIVNGDAMQLYRGMDIGTAKLSAEERSGIPHHLLDVLDVTETASVAAFQRAARAVIESLLSEGRTPVLVGGSALYLRSVVDELSFPGTDPVIRARLQRQLDEEGPGALHGRLEELDPAAAHAVLPSNGRRIVRALEVIELTGQPFSGQLPPVGPPRYEALLLGLDLATDVLDARIDARVEQMFAAGLVDEVRDLIPLGLREGRTAARAVGYQQVLEAFDGEIPLELAAAETAKATRRLVRRQRSWFRRDARIHWLDAAGDPFSSALEAASSG